MDYEVVFSGGIREGHHAAIVMQAFIARLHARPQQLKALFSGKPHVLKRTASRDEAVDLVRRLASMGAVATIKPVASGGKSLARRSVSADGNTAPEPQAANEVACPPPYTPFKGRWTYKPALLLVAGLGAFSALFYFLLLMALLVGNISHAFFSAWLFQLIPIAPLAALAHGLIAIIGVLLLLVLAKPLLALTSDPEHGIPLEPKHEPDLFLFIGDLCERLDVAFPKEIHINNRAAVALDYRRGVRGFFRAELVLTLGLPLITAYDTRLLAAALAGPLAHFSRGTAPRSGYLVMAIYSWLQRAAYERDVLDRFLETQRRAKLSTLAKSAGAVTRLFSLSRGIARWHLTLWTAFAGRLIQRRVADADAASCRTAGSLQFAEALEQSRLLALAETNTLPELQRIWRQKGMLPDDIAMAVRRRAQHYSRDMARQLRQMQEKRKSSCRDILPSDSQRNAYAKRHHQPGEITCTSPASRLFGNFAKLSHRMTVRFYRDRLKLTVTANKLVRTVAKDSEEDRARRSTAEFFVRGYCEFVPLGLRPSSSAEPSSLSELATQWRLAVDEIRRGHSKFRVSYLRWEEADHDLIAATHQEAVQRAGLGGQLGRLGGGKQHLDGVHQACRDAEAAYEEAVTNHAVLSRPFAQRLSCALALLRHPAAAQRLRRAASLASEADRLLEFLGRLEKVQCDLHALRLHAIVVEALINEEQGRKNVKLRDRIAEQCDDIRQLLTGMGVALKGVRHPSGHTAMNYALEKAMQDDESPLAAYDRGTDVAQRLTLAQRAVLSRLIEIALLAEEGFRLKGLDERAA